MRSQASPTVSDAIAAELDKLLGRPFAPHARGPDEFDCLGLVLWLYREALDVALPDPIAHLSLSSMKEFRACFRSVGPVDDAVPGDMLHEQLGRRQHVSLVEDGEWVADVRDGIRVCRLPRTLYRERQSITAWRPRALC